MQPKRRLHIVCVMPVIWLGLVIEYGSPSELRRPHASMKYLVFRVWACFF